MSNARLLSDHELRMRIGNLTDGAMDSGKARVTACKVRDHMAALVAELERWQNAAYEATERADALYEQKEDLQTIIGKQEEELRQARSRAVALESRVTTLQLALAEIAAPAWYCRYCSVHKSAPHEDWCPILIALAALETSDE